MGRQSVPWSIFSVHHAERYSALFDSISTLFPAHIPEKFNIGIAFSAFAVGSFLLNFSLFLGGGGGGGGRQGVSYWL